MVTPCKPPINYEPVLSRLLLIIGRVAALQSLCPRMRDPLPYSGSQHKMDLGKGRAGKKSPGLKKLHGCITLAAGGDAAMLGNDAILGKSQETQHPRDRSQIPARGQCHGPSWVLGAGCATSPAQTSEPIIVPDHIYWLHGKKILNKENKPCATNPRAVSSTQVSNGFSTLLPALSPPSITPRPSPLFQSWDGEAGITSPPGSVAGKAPSVYLRQLFCSCPACQSKHAGAGLLQGG